ncbi:MAG: hypothetical protein WDN04_15745 [Rhodospirillales bacterium]
MVSDPGPLDAQLIALCGQFFALCDLEQPMATAPRQADDAGARAFDRCDAEIWPLKEAIAASITTTRRIPQKASWRRRASRGG